jgi:ABC-type phosphate transport system auxiliary subunit
MKLVLEKLRGQYNELDEKKQSRQVQSIDGLRLEKRRKLLNTSSNHSSNCESFPFLFFCPIITHTFLTIIRFS